MTCCSRFGFRGLLFRISTSGVQVSGFGDQLLNIGALMIRIGVWGVCYAIIRLRNHQNSIGNYFCPYIRAQGSGCSSSCHARVHTRGLRVKAPRNDSEQSAMLKLCLSRTGQT